MPSLFRQPLLRIFVSLAAIYLLLGYSLLLTIIIRKELQILDPKAVFSAAVSGPEAASLHGQIRNVFGDPVPHAVIVLGNRVVQADNGGYFEMTDLKPGRYALEILAGQYQKNRREIQLETGMNSPPFKYETGLWPETFLVDFHIFYTESGGILGIVGFANGSEEAIFIQKAVLKNPRGETITDILADGEGFSYYANLSSKLEVVEKPCRALKWAPRMWQNGEFSPLSDVFPPGLYTLKVHYAFAEGHESGHYQVFTITDHLDLDNNRSPHAP